MSAADGSSGTLIVLVVGAVVVVGDTGDIAADDVVVAMADAVLDVVAVSSPDAHPATAAATNSAVRERGNGRRTRRLSHSRRRCRWQAHR